MAMHQGAAHALRIELAGRGWTVESEYGQVKAGKPGWPVQVYALVHFGDEANASVMALVMDLSAMPLAGERFRDVFNADKDDVLRGFGRFRVRQLLKNGAWAPEKGDQAFLSGLSAGIRPTTRLVMLDICPLESGDALSLRFIAESGRFLGTGNLLAEMLGRIYLPGVLGAAIQPLDLPAMVPVGMPALNHEPEPSHPWRR